MFTPLKRRGGGPLYPVNCPICGKLLGALYRDGYSLKPFAVDCTSRCGFLWGYGKGRSGWRDLPFDLRQIQLAAGVLDHAIQETRTNQNHPTASKGHVGTASKQNEPTGNGTPNGSGF